MFGWSAKQKGEAVFLSGAGGSTAGATISGNAGLVDGTQVATRSGWRPVDRLSLGDEVLTFDHGLQPVTDIRSELYEDGLRPGRRPVRIPAGALGNHSDLWLMPDQGLLVENDALADPLGDPFAVVPAQTLHGYRSIAVTATESIFEATLLSFRCDEAIYVDGGMLAYCPRPRELLAEDEQDTIYEVLDTEAASRLVQAMIHSEAGLVLACDPEELACMKSRNRPRPARLCNT